MDSADLNCMKTPDLATELFLARLRNRIDPRITACVVRVESRAGAVTISGFSQCPQTDTFIRQLARQTFRGRRIAFDLATLERDITHAFQEVAAPVCEFYKAPRIVKKDLLTQARCGTIIRTFHRSGKYIFAQHPDGYVGFATADCLAPVDTSVYESWRNGPTALLSTHMEVGGMDLPPGSRFIVDGATVRLPGGRSARIAASKYRLITPPAAGTAKKVLKLAEAYTNTPYLWGGNTQHGVDCSGFVQGILAQMGVNLPRDASMQAYVGEIVGILPGRTDLRPGDIVFFMNKRAYIHHVGIALDKDTYIHSAGKRGVNIASFVQRGKNFIETYATNYCFGRRLLLP